MKSCAYDCIQCKQSFEATIEHYASSGFRPGRADDSCHYLFDSDLLSFWHHLQHMLPSTSQNKVLEVLGEISNDNYRVREVMDAFNILYPKNVIIFAEEHH